jgi:hypothetical protein
MPDPYTPCGRATPQTALWPVAVFFPLGYPFPYGPASIQRPPNHGLHLQVRASASSFGTYSCNASNSVGSATFVVSLVDADRLAKAPWHGISRNWD